MRKREFARFLRAAKSLARREGIRGLADYPHHGTTNRFTHSLAVAYLSCKIADRLGIRCDKRSMIRGAILHDYFNYNRHDCPKKYRLHGFTHPSVALKNAVRDFDLNPIERDIIKKHMFPLTPTPPRYRESYLVSLADKICASYEFFKKNPYKRLSELFK